MRIRTVKPDFWSHPVMARLDDAARLMAIGVLNLADDEGYFYSDPLLVRNALRPFDEDSTKTRDALAALARIGYIDQATHPTLGPVARVVNFAKHQRVDRPSASRLKGHFDECSTNARRMLDEPSSPEGNGMEGKGHPAPAREDDVPDSLTAREKVAMQVLALLKATNKWNHRDNGTTAVAEIGRLIGEHGEQETMEEAQWYAEHHREKYAPAIVGLRSLAEWGKIRAAMDRAAASGQRGYSEPNI